MIIAQRLIFIARLLCLLILPLASSAQYFDSGQDPSKIKWDQINSEYFQIIYPRTFIKDAQRLANALEISYLYNTQTLKFHPKKISVILHNFSSNSNAFVGWAPRRMEFVTMPPQDIYPQDWLEQLAIHEYRHVIQLSKMNQGLTKILYFLFGEQITAGVLGLYVPLWFVEGDAVSSETSLSNSGRGRLPEFEMQLRAQVLQRKIYPYEKAVFGSYKDFTPDRYVLGYQLVANGRKRYGAPLWDKTLDHVAKHPIAIFPFSKGIKKGSGLSKWKFYQSNMKELDSLWKVQDNKNILTTQKTVNKTEKKVYTNYRFPQILNDSQVVILKSGLADIQQFVLLNNKGEEKVIFKPGYFDPVWLSARKNLIVWPEYLYDKRWENRTYYDIIKYDIATGKRTRLTKHRYLFSPCLSPDASKIAAIEISPENQYSLVILDSKTGKELNKISHPDNEFMLTPTWSENGEQLVLMLLGKKGKSIAAVNMESGTFETLLPYSFKEISQPRFKNNYIYFHGVYSGIDNIYSLDLLTRKIFRVTSSQFGAFDPEISRDGKKILFADYSAMGFNIHELELEPNSWVPLNMVEDNSIKLYETIAKQESGTINFDSLPKKDYPVKRYKKIPHLLNIHSWAPIDFGANNVNLNPAITLLSQNKLSTAIVKASYIYNYNERAGEVITSLSYKALYPVIELSTSNGRRTSGTFPSNPDSKDSSYYSWKEQNYSLSISQNLNFTRGKYNRFFSFIGKGTYRGIYDLNDVPYNLRTGNVVVGELGGTFSRLIKAAERDTRPKWGETLLINYRSSIGGSVTYRNLFSSQASLYLPGILKHHSLLITGVYQNQGEGAYSFSSPVNYIRGYNHIVGFHEFSRVSFDYKLPVAYPDLRLGPVLYLKRIKANLFYDYGYAQNKFRNNTFQSCGIEITNDVHFFNFLAPLNLGFRYVYRPLYKTSALELIFGINFNSI
jgi:Tol biopolymer transport system component